MGSPTTALFVFLRDEIFTPLEVFLQEHIIFFRDLLGYFRPLLVGEFLIVDEIHRLLNSGFMFPAKSSASNERRGICV